MKLLKKLINYFSSETSEVLQNIPEHYKIAQKELGVEEIAGGKANPRIIKYHATTTLKATSDEISWCSSFTNYCLTKAGLKGTNNAAARSFLKWGVEVKKPQVGDVVVFWRGKKTGWQGHVGFYADSNFAAVKVLGGNQNNKVCYQWYPKTQLLGYRRLS